jgi:TonB family protein
MPRCIIQQPFPNDAAMQSFGLRDVPTAHSFAVLPVPELKLVLELPSRQSVFLRNFLDLFRRTPPLPVTSVAAPFWPDVFVSTAFPARAFFQSALYHVFTIVVIWGMSLTWLYRPRQIALHNPLQHATITYYSVSEYLPPLGDLGERPRQEMKGDPERAPQRIISVPRAPDNSRQTIVTPPEIRIHRDVPLPNVVAWTELPVPPPPETNRMRIGVAAMPAPTAVEPPPAVDNARLRMPNLPAPAPVEPSPLLDRSKPLALNMPVPSAIEPPVTLDAPRRKFGDLTVAQLAPQPGAPKLPLPEQRASGATQTPATSTNGAVAPPPAISGRANAATGQLIALSARPVQPTGPIQIPAGRRSGIFAAAPEGRPGAPATPNIPGGGTAASGTATDKVSSGATSGPGGIYIGEPPAGQGPADTAPVDARQILLAHAARQPLADVARQTRPAPSAPDNPKVVDEVFGPKKYYSMILSMPNLTSAGGSWVVRFAELREQQGGGDLRGPVATVKVDPAYPPDLRHAHVEGTVMLYAVIHADGSVGEIRVLHGVDQRLDENARIALSRWRFQPAMKNGNAVDLEAVVQIPFVAERKVY